MSRFLKQGDRRWSKTTLGQGPQTIGQAGCLLTCLVEARNRETSSDELKPDEANRRLLKDGCFVGSALIWRKAAESLGLSPGVVVTDMERGARHAVAKTIQEALDDDGMVLLHVDHDSKLPKGDPAADHWILGYMLQPVDEYTAPGKMRRGWEVACSDPATGETVMLDLSSLSGTSRWGSVPREYQVREVRVLL